VAQDQAQVVAGVGLHADHQAFAVGHGDRDLGAELILLAD